MHLPLPHSYSSSSLTLQLPQCPCTYLDHLISHLQMTWLIRYLEWPMELVIAAWSLGSIYPQYCCVVYQPMKTFSKPVWGYQLQQLLCCETYSIHFKQNAKTSMPEQIKWRGDQNAVFLPYQMATGISVSVCWRLTPMELKLISVHLLKIWDWWHWNPHFCQSCTKKKKITSKV